MMQCCKYVRMYCTLHPTLLQDSDLKQVSVFVLQSCLRKKLPISSGQLVHAICTVCISYVPSTRDVQLIQSHFQSITEGVSPR